MSEPTVVLSAWHGRVADSPLAVAQELRRRGLPWRHVWIAADGLAVPEGAERVAPGSPEEDEALATADWIVSNDVLPGDFAKAPGCTYLQTWHGTPLKRIGFDVRNPRFPDAEYHYTVELGRDVARWDVLLSPSAACTDVLRGAFRFEGPVVETGYPRNDVLVRPQAAELRASVRERLGLAGDVRAALYAPTWRDSFALRLDLDLAAVSAAAGDDVVVLARAHQLTAATAGSLDAPGVVDVTRWPDTAELLLAADVLVTDYSSAMVDFALTGRPVLLYVHDLDEYRDDVRGFYVDFEAQAPGPLLRTPDELVAALRDPGAAAAAVADRRAAFERRYLHLEDGGASARAVDALLAAGRSVRA